MQGVRTRQLHVQHYVEETMEDLGGGDLCWVSGSSGEQTDSRLTAAQYYPWQQLRKNGEASMRRSNREKSYIYLPKQKTCPQIAAVNHGTDP